MSFNPEPFATQPAGAASAPVASAPVASAPGQWAPVAEQRVAAPVAAPAAFAFRDGAGRCGCRRRCRGDHAARARRKVFALPRAAASA